MLLKKKQKTKDTRKDVIAKNLVFDEKTKVIITNIFHNTNTVKFRLKFNKLILFTRRQNSYLYQADGDFRVRDIELMACDVDGCYKLDTRNVGGFHRFLNTNIFFNDYKINGIQFAKKEPTYTSALGAITKDVSNLMDDGDGKRYCSYCGCLTWKECIKWCNRPANQTDDESKGDEKQKKKKNYSTRDHTGSILANWSQDTPR